MDKRRAATTRVFDDFDPVVEWKQADDGEGGDVVEISLPGFLKDQVQVQVDKHGVLRARGERLKGDGRWARFQKDLLLPDDCDADAVRAWFEGEKLIITLPKIEREILVSPPSPSPKEAGVDDGRGKVGMKPPEKKNKAEEVGEAPATEPARQLLLNTAAAVLVLVGIIIVAVWRNLRS